MNNNDNELQCTMEMKCGKYAMAQLNGIKLSCRTITKECAIAYTQTNRETGERESEREKWKNKILHANLRSPFSGYKIQLTSRVQFNFLSLPLARTFLPTMKCKASIGRIATTTTNAEKMFHQHSYTIFVCYGQCVVQCHWHKNLWAILGLYCVWQRRGDFNHSHYSQNYGRNKNSEISTQMMVCTRIFIFDII